MPRPVRVLIVDDSLLMRRVLGELLAAEPRIEVVGEAAEAYEAREKIKALNPDVVTLDVEMPKMDGLSFLEKIMRLRPTPVVMVSTLTASGAEATLKALEIGAVDCVGKPSGANPEKLAMVRDELVAKVLAAASARVTGLGARPAAPAGGKTMSAFGPGAETVLIALGASTGGVEALKAVFARLPPDCPPVVITQHMPPGFTASFAARLTRESAIRVVEAGQEVLLKPGMAALAAGDRHLVVKVAPGGWLAKPMPGEKVSGHCPSVDVMFRSVARIAGARAAGALLTGMGRDGADGLKAMREAGAATLAQDEATSLVYGMPRAAVENHGAEAAIAIDRMADTLVAALRRRMDGKPRVN